LAVAKRQQEIVAALDITKNQASAQVDDGAAMPVGETNETIRRKAPIAAVIA
jgi:hypothetical protein